jgi:rhodanese-related sulfurtransferase
MTKTLVRDERFQLTRNTERGLRFFEDRLSFVMSPHTLNERLGSNEFQIIDVRKPEDFNRDHIPGSINIPIENFETNITKLNRDKINVVYCYNQTCQSSTRAGKMLTEKNYPTMVLEGGMQTWKENNFRTEK